MTTTLTVENVLRRAQFRTRSWPSDWTSWATANSVSFQDSLRVDRGEPLNDWKGRIRRHEQATTMLGVRAVETESQDDVWAFYERRLGPNRFSQEWRGNMPLTGLPSVVDPSAFEISSVKNRVIMNINSQIREANTTLQGLVSLGEMGETVRMINGAGKGLYTSLFGYLGDVRSNIARSASPRVALRRISETWLQYALGIVPLMSDIDAGARALARIRDFREPFIPLRAQSQSSQLDQSLKITENIAGLTVNATAERRSEYGCRIYGCVGLKNPHLGDPWQEFGISLNEFVPTLWELIPHSFLADYVANIGDIIDAYSINKTGVRWLGFGERRTSLIKVMSMTATHPPLNGWRLGQFTFRPGKPYQRRFDIKSRSPWTVSNLVPDLEFKIPGSSRKWLNMAALASVHSSVCATGRAKYYR